MLEKTNQVLELLEVPHLAEREMTDELRQIEGALGMPLTAWKGRLVGSARATKGT